MSTQRTLFSPRPTRAAFLPFQGWSYHCNVPLARPLHSPEANAFVTADYLAKLREHSEVKTVQPAYAADGKAISGHMAVYTKPLPVEALDVLDAEWAERVGRTS